MYDRRVTKVLRGLELVDQLTPTVNRNAPPVKQVCARSRLSVTVGESRAQNFLLQTQTTMGLGQLDSSSEGVERHFWY